MLRNDCGGQKHPQLALAKHPKKKGLKKLYVNILRTEICLSRGSPTFVERYPVKLKISHVEY